MDEASALVDVVDLLIELQSRLVLGVVDVYEGARVFAQQGIHGHAQLHVEALSSLKHLVVVNDDGAHFGVLPLIELYL